MANMLLDDKSQIVLSSQIESDDITTNISKVFDYQFDGTVTEQINVPDFPKDFQIGLIVGSSGSGKSTILHQAFGKEENIIWGGYNKAIASAFDSYEEASNKFGAVGLNSIPTWLKPYDVLSNGEKFRADMARRLKDGAVIDEFTSVVNREVAISCSCSIEKYIRQNNLKRIVFASCHDDIIPYLKPDWIYNTDTRELYSGRCLQRPKIDIRVLPCTRDAWTQFKKYHYLSGDLNGAATCFMATMNDAIVGFIAVIAFPSGSFKHGFREHRLVIHPDYQGMGIGNKLSEMIADAYVKCGCKYFAKTSNPRIGEHRDKSPLWKPTCNNHRDRKDYIRKDGSMRGGKYYHMDRVKTMFHAQRVCYSHEYIGDGKIYPYTYQTQEILKSNQIDGQMTIFDFIKGD